MAGGTAVLARLIIFSGFFLRFDRWFDQVNMHKNPILLARTFKPGEKFAVREKIFLKNYWVATLTKLKIHYN